MRKSVLGVSLTVIATTVQARVYLAPNGGLAALQSFATAVTVAITDAYASPTIEQDADRYATDTGDKPFAAGQFSQSLPRTYTNVNSNR